MRIRLLLTFFVLVTAQLQLAAQPLYSQLEDGDQVDILFHSQGCFHNYHDCYLIERNQGIIKYSYFTVNWLSGSSEWSYELVGEMELNERQIQLLDSELKLYRKATPVTKEEGADGHWIVERFRISPSTTTTTLALKYVESGKLLGTELIQNPEFLGITLQSSALHTIKRMLVEAQEQEVD